MNFESIPNSKTFLLTIPRNAKRYLDTAVHLFSQGIEPSIFTGIDGDVAGLETKWPLRFFGPITDPTWMQRVISLYLGHYMLWKTCSYQPYDAFVILEDDVRMTTSWRSDLARSMVDIPNDWDLLFLGSCCTEGHPGRQQIKDLLWKLNYANCTHAYAVRAKALPVLLERLQRVDTKLDIALAIDAMPHLNCFAILPTIALQEGTLLHP